MALRPKHFNLPGVFVTEGLGLGGVHDHEGGGECVGQGGAGGEGVAALLLNGVRAQGAGIHEMGTFDHETAATEGAVTKVHAAGAIGEGDAPGLFVSRTAKGEEGAVASVEEGVGDAPFFKNGGGLIEGVAFADGSEIEDHVIGVNGDAEVAFIEIEELGADAAAGVGEAIWLWLAEAAVFVAPELHEGADSDVEGSGGFFKDGLGEGEAVPCGEGDAEALPGAELIELGDVAAVAEAAEFVLQTGDLGEDGLGGLGGVEGIDFG